MQAGMRAVEFVELGPLCRWVQLATLRGMHCALRAMLRAME